MSMILEIRTLKKDFNFYFNLKLEAKGEKGKEKIYQKND